MLKQLVAKGANLTQQQQQLQQIQQAHQQQQQHQQLQQQLLAVKTYANSSSGIVAGRPNPNSHTIDLTDEEDPKSVTKPNYNNLANKANPQQYVIAQQRIVQQKPAPNGNNCNLENRP